MQTQRPGAFSIFFYTAFALYDLSWLYIVHQDRKFGWNVDFLLLDNFLDRSNDGKGQYIPEDGII